MENGAGACWPAAEGEFVHDQPVVFCAALVPTPVPQVSAPASGKEWRVHLEQTKHHDKVSMLPALR